MSARTARLARDAAFVKSRGLRTYDRHVWIYVRPPRRSTCLRKRTIASSCSERASTNSTHAGVDGEVAVEAFAIVTFVSVIAQVALLPGAHLTAITAVPDLRHTELAQLLRTVDALSLIHI